LLAGRRMGESLAAFTPWAVAAAAAIALTGALNAWLSLASPAQLIDSGYGVTLVAKTAAFAAMAGLGATHWLRRRAAARKQPESAALRAPARGELVAAVLALALASLLAGFPNPPRAQGSAPAFATIDPVLARLAGRPAASVAEASGPFVVGLTILPPRPGRVEMRVQVLGLEAGDAPRDAKMVAVSPRGVASTTNLAACGLGCFAGTGSLAETGRWALGVRIATNRGAITVDMGLPLPTADGTSVLRTAQAAMGRLRSTRLHETLGSEVGGPRITSDYAFTAPDAMRVEVGETSRIIIGSSEWQRSSAQAAWEQTTWPGTPFAWPSAYFSALWGQPVAVRVVGQEVVDGHPSTIVAFLRADIPAWFRLWVGDDGLVRRQEMRAEAHLMDHTLTDLNAPVTITPPG